MLTTCSVTTNYISMLDDEPNDVGGLTAAELKAKFDQAGSDLKDWINNVHITEEDARMNASTGHKHTGVAGDAPKLTPADSVLYTPAGINLMPDSGRFCANSPATHKVTTPFAESLFFIPYNSSVAESGGKFIHNNTTYGGTAEALTQDVIDLLSALETKAGRIIKRYGVEFYILQLTMGSGTSGLYNGKYLLTTNGMFPLGNNYSTWGFWIRIKSGGSVYIKKGAGAGDILLRDLSKVTGSYTEIIPSDGWVHIICSHYLGMGGYDNSLPLIYANQNDVVQIALPYVITGQPLGIDYHTAPLPTSGHQAGYSYTPTLTWTGTAPASVTTVARYTIIGNRCIGDIYISSADGNGATGLKISLPVTPRNNNSVIAITAQQKVGTTWANRIAYIDDDSGNGIQFRDFATCTDGQAVEVIVHFDYEI